ncbi:MULTISPECIES: alpha/beta hydrolase [Paenibacillus]|uniref:Esterase family protein n=1 Tax=Paenibacillus lutimineralis TaxID=2707005 RepID=A0A3Q9IC91_9BACL|nr:MULTISPECIES: alpha/beta hydrolase-fold protein [Paenibacillus]AZS15006.1 esterase family protein [Paenibacillus lutimineralis]NWL90341.1 esterase family protein [Paenibacillus sp. 79R4]
MTDSRYLKRTIIKEEIDSKHLGEKRSLRIYLPPGYNEVISYPVVYCQDGEEFFNFGRIATTANQLILDEDVDPFIIVGVEVDTSVRTAEYSPEGDRFEAYTACFIEEIIPFVERNYPVRRTAQERILAGDSLGGSVSLHIAMKNRTLFSKIISMSGAYYEPSLKLIAAEQDLSYLSLYMIIGLQEDKFTNSFGTYNFVELNREAKKLLEERGAKVKYFEKDGQHLWGFWQKELPEALMYFLK